MKSLVPSLVKLVIFLVVTSVATYILAATISNESFGSTRTYHAEFTDVSGLNIGDDVRVAGVRVGSIDDIKIVKHNLAEVAFSVAKTRPLPSSVQLQLRYRNLVGQRYLDVSQGTGSTSMQNPSQVIPTSQTHPAVDLTVLFNGFQPLFQGLDSDQINQLSMEIIQTLQGEGSSIYSLLSTLADLTQTIADKDQVIGQVIDNLTSVLTTVGDRDTELTNLINQLQGFVSGLAQDRDTIGNAISGINDLATSTSGLLTNIRAPLKKDVTDITGLLGVINDNKSTVNRVINTLGPTVGTLVRTASYGSWFNFYLCSINTTLTLPGGSSIDLGVGKSNQARCQ